jgi:hypothetical protein
MTRLLLPPKTLQFIIAKAREYDVEVPPVDDETGSNPTDDGDVSILESRPDNPTREELVAAIEELHEGEAIELLAMTWLGRGDFSKDEWPAALRQAHQRRDRREAEYLAGTPLLADDLEEGLSLLGYSLDEIAGVEIQTSGRGKAI